MPNVVRMTPKVCAMPDDKHENLYIEIELPGVDKDQINLNMHDESFFVTAKKEGVEYSGTYAVCCPIDYHQAKARYKNGLLSVTVPFRANTAKCKSIPIE